MAEMEGITLKGTIRAVRRCADGVVLRVLRQDKSEINVLCGDPCFAREDDLIYGNRFVEIEYDGKVALTSPGDAFVIDLPQTDEAIIRTIMINLKTGYKNAVAVYGGIKRNSGSTDPKDVYLYVSDLASRYDRFNSSDLLGLLPIDDLAKARGFLQYWHKQRNLRILHCMGMNNSEIRGSLMTTEEIHKACFKNPYVIPSVCLEKCEIIMAKTGVVLDDPKTHRRCAEILRLIWKDYKSNSRSSMPLAKLENQKIKVTKPMVTLLISDYGIVFSQLTRCLYLKQAYVDEKCIAKHIDELLRQPPLARDPVLAGTTLNSDQLRAVRGALLSRICIINGGAGTGKSTCIKHIVEQYEIFGYSYRLCSFTGKAVARIREVTGKTANTIHRLIGMGKDPTCHHVIVDEASTISSSLYCSLLGLYPNLKSVVLVGDQHQLPPIDAGAVFTELIKSGVVPVFHLKQNYRSKMENSEIDNSIVLNGENIVRAAEIRDKGRKHSRLELSFEDNVFLHEELDAEGGGDYDPTQDPNLVLTTVTEFCAYLELGIDVKDIIILTPLNDHKREINNLLQEHLDQGAASIVDTEERRWMVGDRVMVNKNCASLNIYNGDIGTVIMIKKSQGIVVVDMDFNSISIDFSIECKKRDKWEDDEIDITGESRPTTSILDLAYAISIDKSQGSEWEYVIFHYPATSSGDFFRHYKRIYTALTRAKKVVHCIVHSREFLEQAAVQDPPPRYDGIAAMILEQQSSS